MKNEKMILKDKASLKLSRFYELLAKVGQRWKAIMDSSGKIRFEIARQNKKVCGQGGVRFIHTVCPINAVSLYLGRKTPHGNFEARNITSRRIGLSLEHADIIISAADNPASRHASVRGKLTRALNLPFAPKLV